MSIHPTAIVHEGAELAADVVLGPYAVVGEGVQLQSGVTVGAHATITGPTTVGDRCQIFPYAAIGGDAQDKSFWTTTIGGGAAHFIDQNSSGEG